MSVVDRFVVWSNSLLVSTTCRLHFGGILIATGRWAEAEEELTAAIRLSFPRAAFGMTTRPPRCPDHGGGDDGFASNTALKGVAGRVRPAGADPPYKSPANGRSTASDHLRSPSEPPKSVNHDALLMFCFALMTWQQMGITW